MALANILSRRSLIKGAAAALPALALPAMVLDVDPHPEWLALWRAARVAVNSAPGDADDHPLWTQFEAMESRILNTPAATPAGVAAQLTLLAEETAFALPDAVQMALTRAAQTLTAAQGGIGHA